MGKGVCMSVYTLLRPFSQCETTLYLCVFVCAHTRKPPDFSEAF